MIIRATKTALKRIPLKVGDIIAWIIIGLWAGFALGWIANAERLSAYCANNFVN